MSQCGNYKHRMCAARKRKMKKKKTWKMKCKKKYISQCIYFNQYILYNTEVLQQLCAYLYYYITANVV